MSEDKLGLAEVIDKVRDELSESITRGAAHPAVKFEYSEVMVEFEIAVSNEAGGNGGINVWVVSAGAQAKHSSTRTHRVNVLMKPSMQYDGSWVTANNESGFSGTISGPVTIFSPSKP